MALILGGFGKDNLTGTAKADQIFGFWGNDRIAAGAGNDVLSGGAGADTLDGGLGFDTANYAASKAGVTISLLTGIATGGEANGDRLASIEGLYGSLVGDSLTGSDVNNHLYGLSGDDAISGRGGNDKIDGGLGSDLFAGGSGADTFIFRPHDGKDRILDFAAPLGDRLNVSAHDYASLADVLADARQAGADTIIDFGGGDQVTLVGVLKAALDATDFVI